MWLTKDITLPEPVQMSLEKEQGSYVFFNQMAWEKVRVRKADPSPLPIVISPTATDWRALNKGIKLRATVQATGTQRTTSECSMIVFSEGVGR